MLAGFETINDGTIQLANRTLASARNASFRRITGRPPKRWAHGPWSAASSRQVLSFRASRWRPKAGGQWLEEKLSEIEYRHFITPYGRTL